MERITRLNEYIPTSGNMGNRINNNNNNILHDIISANTLNR